MAKIYRIQKNIIAYVNTENEINDIQNFGNNDDNCIIIGPTNNSWVGPMTNINNSLHYLFETSTYYISQFWQLKTVNIGVDLHECYFVVENEDFTKNDEYMEMSYDQVLILESDNMLNKKSHIGIYHSVTDQKLANVFITNNNSNSRFLYSVGLMSDIHYNDGDDATSNNNPDTYSDDGSEYYPDLLNFFNAINNHKIDFVACTGDITTDRLNHSNNYKFLVDKYVKDKNQDLIGIFSCVGNHDTIVKAYEREDQNGDYTVKWTDIDSIQYKDDITINRIDKSIDGDGTSYYFIYKDDVYIFLNLNYGSGLHTDTHNPTNLTSEEISTYYSDITPSKSTNPVNGQSNSVHLYNPQTLEWFANLLERYKNLRCFIFTHIMFRDGAGNYKGVIGPYEYFYTHRDVMTGYQGEFMKKLRDKYANNIWFCGHSHYQWNWQFLDKDINRKKHKNGSYSFHLPSLARPLKVIYDDTDMFNTSNAYGNYNSLVNYLSSEYALMDVYNDHVEIHGYVGKDSNQSYGTLTPLKEPNIIQDNYQFNANDMDYLTYASGQIKYNKSLASWQATSSAGYVSDYNGWLKIEMKNYNYFEFTPNNPSGYNSIDILVEDIIILPYVTNSNLTQEPSLHTSYVTSFIDNHLPYNETFMNVNNIGAFKIYTDAYFKKVCLPLETADRTLYTKLDATKPIVMRLGDFRYTGSEIYIRQETLDKGLVPSEVDTFLRDYGFTIYMKLKYKLYNIPNKESNYNFTSYYNRIISFADYSLPISQP